MRENTIIELSEDYFIFSNAPHIVTYMPIESITYVKFSEIKQSNIGYMYLAVILFILGIISILVQLDEPAYRKSFGLGIFVITASVFSYMIYIFSQREFRGIELYSYGFVEKLNMTSLKTMRLSVFHNLNPLSSRVQPEFLSFLIRHTHFSALQLET
jgi:hypothetical protein